jgi:hypothetical protein
MRFFALLLLAAFLCGCTTIRYGEFKYMAFLQKKTLTLKVNPQTGEIDAAYGTEVDPAVQELARLAGAKLSPAP